jgi:chemotaxis protein methyltransferase CheR
MIYFDRQTQERLVTRMTNFLEPGGHLFIGHSESLNGLKQPLQYVRPATYMKPRSGTGILVKGFSRL